MKLKILLYVIVVFNCFHSTSGQSILSAGSYLPNNYYHVVFDPYRYVNTDITDTIDFNGDTIPDFYFEISYTEEYPRFQIPKSSLIYIIPLNRYFKLAYKDDHIKTFKYNDTININDPSKHSWINKSSHLFYGCVDYDCGPEIEGNYIAFRFDQDNSAYYGWAKIRPSTDGGGLWMYEFFCQADFTKDTIIVHNEEENEENPTGKLLLYPNPTGLILFFSGISDTTGTVSIYNMAGVNMANYSLADIAINDSNLKAINVSYLPKGLYIVSILSDEKYITRTFVKK